MHRNTHSRADGGSVETPCAISAGLYELYYSGHCTISPMDWQEEIPKACEEGLIPHDATVVSVVTGNGLKDVANAIKSAGSPVHIEPDLDLMVEEFKKRGVVVE